MGATEYQAQANLCHWVANALEYPNTRDPKHYEWLRRGTNYLDAILRVYALTEEQKRDPAKQLGPLEQRIRDFDIPALASIYGDITLTRDFRTQLQKTTQEIRAGNIKRSHILLFRNLSDHFQKAADSEY